MTERRGPGNPWLYLKLPRLPRQYVGSVVSTDASQPFTCTPDSFLIGSLLLSSEKASYLMYTTRKWSTGLLPLLSPCVHDKASSVSDTATTTGWVGGDGGIHMSEARNKGTVISYFILTKLSQLRQSCKHIFYHKSWYISLRIWCKS